MRGRGGVNARGGIGARHEKVKMVFCNTKDDPNLAVACAREMVSDHAAAVIGSDTINDTAVFPILAAAHIPSIANGGAAAAEYTSPYSYPMDSGGFFPWEQLIIFDAKKLHDHVAWLVIDIPAGTSTAAIIEHDLSGVVHFTGTTLVPATTSDYAPVVAQAEVGSPKPTGVAFFAASPLVGPFVRAAVAANAGFKHYLWQGVDPTIFSTIPAAARSETISASPVVPVATLQKTHNALFEQMSADLRAEEKYNSLASPSKLIPQSMELYLAGVAIQAASAKLTKITAATLKKALDKTKNISLGGMMPPWTPSRRGPSAAYKRLSNGYQYIIQYHANGQPTLLWPYPFTAPQAIAGNFGGKG